ncbi:MAG: DinB family protein [Anaerolineales bacterium]|nr:DinB family protein [Anaerolineales bacterium]
MPRVAVLTPQQFGLLQTLRAAPNRVAELLATFPAEAHNWSPAPEDWTAPQVVTHLVATDVLFVERFKRMLNERNPTVPYFDAEHASPDGAARAADALVRFAAGRQALLDLLAPLPPVAWDRPAVHARSGPTTLGRQVLAVAEHDREHVAQLAALRAAWEQRPAR